MKPVKLHALVLAVSLASASHGESVYMDFGSRADFSTSSPMYILKDEPDWSGVWRWNDTNHMGFYENETDFYWVKEPANADQFINSRAIIFRKFAKLYIDASALPKSGALYLSIRYKDNLMSGTHKGAPLWSNGLLGTIGGANDHRWKTETIEVRAENLDRKGDDFVIRFGENYSDQLAGELSIDKVKLSTDRNTPEFESDAKGLWPSISTAKLKFSNIGRNNEYIPGEGAFFPFGIYLGTTTMISDGGSANSPGTGAMDTWQILENAHVNTVVIHGWTQDWGSRWVPFQDEKPWAAPGRYVEMGLEQILTQAAGHNIKVIPNFLTDTRAYWIDEKQNGSPEMVAELAGIVKKYSDNPSILGWNPVDEWDHEDTGYTKPHLFSHQMYQICKENDPNRSVWMSLMGFGGKMGWKVAAAEADAFSNDKYFDESSDLVDGARAMANNLDTMREVFGDEKAIISIPKFGGTNADMGSYHGVKRMPNEAEVLFQAYLAISHGAQGLLYFAFKHPATPDINGLESAWDGYYKLGDEMFGDEGIAHALISPSKTVDIMGERGVVASSNSSIDFILKETAYGAQLLIAVNMSESPQKTTFSVKGLSDGVKPVHFEDRSVRVQDGRLSDSFGRFERHVYVLKGRVGSSNSQGVAGKPLPPLNISLKAFEEQ